MSHLFAREVCCHVLNVIITTTTTTTVSLENQIVLQPVSSLKVVRLILPMMEKNWKN